jgi:hypothetical protein
MNKIKRRLGTWAIPALVFYCPPVVLAENIPPQPVDGKIHWVYDYAEGQRLARTNHKPLFVVLRCER